MASSLCSDYSKSQPQTPTGIHDGEKRTIKSNTAPNTSRQSTSSRKLRSRLINAFRPKRKKYKNATMTPPSSFFKVFILVLQPSTRTFDIVEINYLPKMATIADLLKLIPVNCSIKQLGRQKHVGLCRPFDTADIMDIYMKASGKQRDGSCARIYCGEILVAIPKGDSGKNCQEQAQSILKNPKILKMLCRDEPLKKVRLKKKSPPREITGITTFNNSVSPIPSFASFEESITTTPTTTPKLGDRYETKRRKNKHYKRNEEAPEVDGKESPSNLRIPSREYDGMPGIPLNTLSPSALSVPLVIPTTRRGKPDDRYKKKRRKSKQEPMVEENESTSNSLSKNTLEASQGGYNESEDDNRHESDVVGADRKQLNDKIDATTSADTGYVPMQKRLEIVSKSNTLHDAKATLLDEIADDMSYMSSSSSSPVIPVVTRCVNDSSSATNRGSSSIISNGRQSDFIHYMFTNFRSTTNYFYERLKKVNATWLYSQMTIIISALLVVVKSLGG